MRRISVIGVGFVGLHLAVNFGLICRVVAYSPDKKRIQELQNNYDCNSEISSEELKKIHVQFTIDPAEISKADFYIVAVPSPIDIDNKPDLSYVLNATKTIANYLKAGDIVVYETTLYPGATEEVCIPLLEKISKLKNGKDFFVGYSPERINPGTKRHSFTNTPKLVAAQDENTLKIIKGMYKKIIKAELYPLLSIKVAEASKVIENTQRDVNIALINEFTHILHRLNIDSHEVFKAASTKWNFISLQPGLVGGYCMGVVSYYLAYKAQQVKYKPNLILAGRKVNERMGKYIAECTIKQLCKLNKNTTKFRVAILGLTYKENVPDMRFSIVVDMIEELLEYNVDIFVHDPILCQQDVNRDIELVEWEEMPKQDAIIIAVKHDQYKKLKKNDLLEKLFLPGIIMDVKRVLDAKKFKADGVKIWQL